MVLITCIVGLTEASREPADPFTALAWKKLVRRYRTARLTRDLRAIEEHFSRHRRREIVLPLATKAGQSLTRCSSCLYLKQSLCHLKILRDFSGFAVAWRQETKICQILRRPIRQVRTVGYTAAPAGDATKGGELLANFAAATAKR